MHRCLIRNTRLMIFHRIILLSALKNVVPRTSVFSICSSEMVCDFHPSATTSIVNKTTETAVPNKNDFAVKQTERSTGECLISTLTVLLLVVVLVGIELSRAAARFIVRASCRRAEYSTVYKKERTRGYLEDFCARLLSPGVINSCKQAAPKASYEGARG